MQFIAFYDFDNIDFEKPDRFTYGLIISVAMAVLLVWFVARDLLRIGMKARNTDPDAR